MQRWIGELPPLPWRVCLLAALARLLLARSAPSWIPATLLPWLSSLDELLLSYAALLLAAWLFYDLPTALGLWRAPAKILRDLALLLIMSAFTVVIVQQQVKINLVSLVTASAVLTAVIGLAAQETLKDLFAGITLQLDPPFRLGDWISIGESSGVVMSLTLMNTEIMRFDGSVVVLPNSYVAEEHLRRLRAEEPLGVHFKIGLDYSFPPAQAQRLLYGVLARNQWVLVNPASSVWIDSYGDSAIIYEILAYAQGSSQFAMRDLRSSLLLEIWYALRREGQSIPFPVRQIYAQRRQAMSAHDVVNASIAERFDALRCNPLFASLDAQLLQQLAVLTSIEDYAPGESVVVEGDDDDDLFQVLTGRLEVCRAQPADGRSCVVASLSEGDIFGEMSLLLDAPRSATVRTLVESRLLRVQRQHIAALLDQDPTIVESLAQIVERRQRSLDALNEKALAGSGLDILSTMKHLFGAIIRRS
ncbi:MAG: cyclic nucleotide-binding domain-containing protein [Prochlorococcaceae cyanobacterium]